MRKLPCPPIVILLGTLLLVTARADFSSVQLGAAWKYRGSVMVKPFGLRETSFDESLEIKVVRMEREDSSGGLLWTIQMRDSLFNRWEGGPYQQPPKPLKDTVLIGSIIIKEQDSAFIRISPKPWDSRSLGYYVSELLDRDHYFAPRKAPAGFGLVSGTTDGFEAKEAISWEWKVWIVRGIGLYWWDYIGVAGCDQSKRILRLESFNGIPVDIGVPTPSSPLAKEARISCSTIRRVSPPGPNISLENGVSADLLGRIKGGKPSL